RNSKFVRYGVILLGLVVLRTMAQNGFCPMCTKECCIVLTCSKPFWGQFWGQIFETDSRTLQSNKCAVFVPLRNADTNMTRFSHRKSPTNRYISFTFRQEIVRKYHATAAPHTTPVAARNAPVWARSQSVGIDARPAIYRPKFPAFGAFFPRKAFPAQALPGRVSPVQEKPALINTK
ncbi:hypothetical protein, partial [Gemmiger formicilis]|uniref:hypothetical protein n=1 Tax=Gemmiger formicilis TaxID=745368 RepID=UPI0035214E65